MSEIAQFVGMAQHRQHICAETHVGPLLELREQRLLARVATDRQIGHGLAEHAKMPIGFG